MADVRQEALAYFVRMGWTPEQAAGIVANLVAESGLNPAAVGDGGAAYGIAQWHADRQANFASIIGKPIRGSGLQDQLAFVHAELNGTEKAAGSALRLCTAASQAGAVVSTLYERPADRDGEAAKRGSLAIDLLAQYKAAPQAPQDQPQAPIAPAPAPDTPPAPEAQPVPILALISAFGPLIAQLIPQIANVVSGDRAKQNLDLAGKVFDTITQATASPNLQAAVEAMQADPAVAKKATDAVVTHPDIQPQLQLIETGGGPAAARAADLKQQAQAAQPGGEPFWKGSAVFWMSVLLVPMVFWYVGSSIVGGTPIPDAWPWYAQMPLKLFGSAWDSGARVGLANLVVGLVLGGICGVYYGVSVTQQKQQAQQSSQSGDSPASS